MSDSGEKKEFPSDAITAYQRGQKEGYDRGYFQGKSDARREMLKGKPDGWCAQRQDGSWILGQFRKLDPSSYWKNHGAVKRGAIKILPVKIIAVDEVPDEYLGEREFSPAFAVLGHQLQSEFDKKRPSGPTIKEALKDTNENEEETK